MMTVSVRPRQTLTNFLDYRQETMGIVGLDTAHLIRSVKSTFCPFVSLSVGDPPILNVNSGHCSGLVFEENSLGMAVPDSVCTDRAVGITRVGLRVLWSSPSFVFIMGDRWPFQDPDSLDPSQVASGLLHMIDHTLGLQHENEAKEETEGACQCEDWYGCIMSQKPLWVVSTSLSFL